MAPTGWRCHRHEDAHYRLPLGAFFFVLRAFNCFFSVGTQFAASTVEIQSSRVFFCISMPLCVDRLRSTEDRNVLLAFCPQAPYSNSLAAQQRSLGPGPKVQVPCSFGPNSPCSLSCPVPFSRLSNRLLTARFVRPVDTKRMNKNVRTKWGSIGRTLQPVDPCHPHFIAGRRPSGQVYLCKASRFSSVFSENVPFQWLRICWLLRELLQYRLTEYFLRRAGGSVTRTNQ